LQISASMSVKDS